MTTEFSNYPMGPSVRTWLKVSDYRGDKGDDPTTQQTLQFTEFLLHQCEENTIEKEEQLIDLLDELLSMDLPLVVLKLADTHQTLWQRNDFRGVQAEGLAAMVTGELARAELCFRKAQELAPSEPAPYVNLAQIMQHDGRWPESWLWGEAGLRVEPNNCRLWEIAAAYFQAQSENPVGAILQLAQELQSWAGYSIAADLDPLANQTSKAGYLEPFFASGERSPEFLIEYTGALGIAGQFDKIPAILWQAEKLSAQNLPWQLHMHGAQAQLAMSQNAAFLAQADKILKRSDLPHNVREGLDALIKEVQLEGQTSHPN